MCDRYVGAQHVSAGSGPVLVIYMLPMTDVIDLGRVDATSVGRLLAASGASDIADAHVVICARRADQPVVTSDPGDLRQLDPALRLIAL